MAQNSRHGGPSLTPEEAADPQLPSSVPIRVRRPEVGPMKRHAPVASDVPEVEEPSAGNNSNPSTQKHPVSEETQKVSPRKPARTTGNRSKAGETDPDSSALSTDGNGQNNASKPSDDVDFGI